MCGGDQSFLWFDWLSDDRQDISSTSRTVAPHHNAYTRL